MLSDHQLLRRVADEDEDAFRTLYDRFADRVFRYAFTILRNQHLSEEVAQETMIALWKSAPRFEARSKVSTWIFGIARNKAYDLIRREKRGDRVPDVALVTPDPAPGLLKQKLVAGAMVDLPESQREVVFLTFYEGLSYGEISRVLGIPEGTVKSRMFHAKRKLAEALT
ncbi:MAG: RNA polymerase sigma factor [Candidatus Bipolaricaulia bacterium]